MPRRLPPRILRRRIAASGPTRNVVYPRRWTRGGKTMMGGGHWVFGILFWALVVLAIAALIKYLAKK